VFDQFVRRRANQVHLGYFVGLGIYAYVVLAAVQKDTPPTIELGCAHTGVESPERIRVVAW